MEQPNPFPFFEYTYKRHFLLDRMKNYRNSTQIVGTILETTSVSDREGVQITTLMTKANLPYPRLTKFLENLIGSGLVNKIEQQGKNTFIITERGRIYLQEYKKLNDFRFW